MFALGIVICQCHDGLFSKHSTTHP